MKSSHFSLSTGPKDRLRIYFASQHCSGRQCCALCCKSGIVRPEIPNIRKHSTSSSTFYMYQVQYCTYTPINCEEPASQSTNTVVPGTRQTYIVSFTSVLKEVQVWYQIPGTCTYVGHVGACMIYDIFIWNRKIGRNEFLFTFLTGTPAQLYWYLSWVAVQVTPDSSLNSWLVLHMRLQTQCRYALCRVFTLFVVLLYPTVLLVEGSSVA